LVLHELTAIEVRAETPRRHLETREISPCNQDDARLYSRKPQGLGGAAMKFVTRGIVALSIWSVAVWASPQAMAQERSLAGQDAAVGEVRFSLLSPADFLNLYGSDWTLLDGQNVSSKPIAPYLPSELQIDGGVFLPDARGRFLRMINHGAEADVGDPAGQRHVGNSQADSVASHAHQYAVPRADGSKRRAGKAGEDRFNALRTDDNTTETTAVAGGDETRPRNVAVNVYVRISCTTGGRC
jgi:hypothetical protein